MRFLVPVLAAACLLTAGCDSSTPGEPAGIQGSWQETAPSPAVHLFVASQTLRIFGYRASDDCWGVADMSLEDQGNGEFLASGAGVSPFIISLDGSQLRARDAVGTPTTYPFPFRRSDVQDADLPRCAV